MSDLGNSSSSKSLLWMTVALFSGFGLLLGGGLFMANHLVHSLGLAAATGRNTVRTPTGGFRMEQQAQVGPGLPVYPRSSLQLPGTGSTAKELQDAKDGVTTVTYRSPDDRDAVDGWYAQHLSAEFTRHSSTDQPFSAPFEDVHVDDGDIAFLAARADNIRVVELSTEPTGTKIYLVRTHAPAPPATPQQ